MVTAMQGGRPAGRIAAVGTRGAWSLATAAAVVLAMVLLVTAFSPPSAEANPSPGFKMGREICSSNVRHEPFSTVDHRLLRSAFALGLASGTAAQAACPDLLWNSRPSSQRLMENLDAALKLTPEPGETATVAR
jgi:hypothetical protein